MTPLDLVLAAAGPTIALALVGLVALAFAAAALDYLSGTTGATPPFLRASERRIMFFVVGLPAGLFLFIAASTLGGIGAGTATIGGGMTALAWLVDAAFIIVVALAGSCSVLARNWVVATFAFLAGLAAFLLLLAAIAAQPPANPAGLVTSPGARTLFGVTVGAIMVVVALCAAALLGLVAYVAERVVLLFRARRLPPLHGAR